MVKTMQDWDDEERDDMDHNAPKPGESAEDYFTRTGYMATEPGTPSDGTIHKQEGGSYRSEKHLEEVAQFGAIQDQMVMEAAGFGREVVAYFQELIKGGIPFQAVLVLAREWQQAEIQRRTNLDAMEMRLDHE